MNDRLARAKGETEQPMTFGRLCVERALKDLPAMPGVVTRVLEETDKEDPSAANLERLISSDQALVSKVLRVVNSAYYGLPGQVTSVGQAVVILGLQQVRNLVLSVGAVSAMPIRSPKQQETLRQFWVHSFGTAAATQLMGKKKGASTRDTEAMFVGGLLHDIGRLFLFSHFPDVYEQILAKSNEGSTIEEAELRAVGMTHGEIGALMGSKWQLPEVLVSIIREHEGPFEASASPVLLAVHIGDAITKHLYLSTEEPHPISQTALDWLDFDEDEFQWLRDETDAKVDQATKMFGMLAA